MQKQNDDIRSLKTQVYAREMAHRLGEKNYMQFLEIVIHVPKRLLQMALEETEKAKSFDMIKQPKTKAFKNRLKFYVRTYGVKVPKRCWKI